MRSLVASQAALVARGAVAPVLLAKLELFSNYGSGTVSKTYWWTLGAGVRYPWGGTARSFDPVIVRCSPIGNAIEHVPNADSIDTRRGTLTLELANARATAAGASLWSVLRTENLAFARLTLATVLLEAQRRARLEPLGTGANRWFDLSDYAGTEHLVRFRGELTAVGIVTAGEIPLVFEPLEPEMNWPTCTSTDAHPEDLGLRYPLVVGAAKGIRCVRRHLQAYREIPDQKGTLNANITSATTGTVAADVTLFLSGGGFHDPTFAFVTANFSVQIDSEILLVQKSGTQLNILVRGRMGTTAASHTSGALIQRVAETGALNASLTDTFVDNFVAVTSAGNFPNDDPSESFYARIGDEILVLVAQDGQPSALLVEDRAQRGTIATAHASSATITRVADPPVLLDPVVWVANGARSDSVGAVYLEIPSGSPLGNPGDLILFPPAQYTVALNNTTVDPGRTVTTISIAASVVFGLEEDHGAPFVLVVDVSGPEVPGSGYKASSGDLVEHPADVVKWLVETFGAGAVDVSTDPSALGDLELAGDLREFGETFGELLAAIAFHSGRNVVARPSDSGVDFLLRGPNTSFSFGAAARTLSDLRRVQESRKLALERATRFLALYDPRPYRKGEVPGEFGIYRGVFLIGSDQNDLGTTLDAEIDAAELLRGVRQAERLAFPLLADRDTIGKVFGYYAFAALFDGGRFSAEIPWADGYDLEPGDVVEFVPWLGASTVKARLVSIPFDPAAAAIGVALEEVE